MSTPRTPAINDPSRRGFDPTAPRTQGRTGREATESKKLIVGRDISLSGTIASCDVLVVEGAVEATLKDSQAIEIADTGQFNGEVEIDRADISGRFDGAITVRGRLTVRSTGKVVGTIRYGEIEIEAGGVISGDVQMMVPQFSESAAGDRSEGAPKSSGSSLFGGSASKEAASDSGDTKSSSDGSAKPEGFKTGAAGGNGSAKST